MSKSIQNKTIPIYNVYYDFDETINFYTNMGFEITYYQKAPYRYASVKSDFTEIHFFGNKNHDKEKTISSSFVVVSDVQKIHKQVKSNLKKNTNKISYSGIPRISRLNHNSEDIRFTIVDPSGNYILVGQPIEKVDLNKNDDKTTNLLDKQFDIIHKFAYSKEDYLGALNLINKFKSSNGNEISLEMKYKIEIITLEMYMLLEKSKNIIKDQIEKIKTFNIDESNLELKFYIDRFYEILEEVDK